MQFRRFYLRRQWRGSAIKTAQVYEEERHGTMNSITRLTQLYDLEKVFSSTLEMEELLPLIGSKFMEILRLPGSKYLAFPAQ